MINLIRKLSQPFVWRLYKWYLSSPQWFKYEDIEVRILPTVFHPGWLLSTKTLLKFLKRYEFIGKHVLELGAGSGIISLYTAKQGAIVTASDINPIAIQAIQESTVKNNLLITLIESDLFEKIQPQQFDYIIINPPYFPKDPVDDWEKAFYCGSNFDYFQALFNQIGPYRTTSTCVYMILSENCNINTIQTIAGKNNFSLVLVHNEIKSYETQYIFEIR